ncbi:hypothetical protein QE152_g32655 [Popillia japonica]|uniref:Uncharacterized protein n=1 Tax=Popillia japonica TaxID=7064 RepID=A0AAW1IY21_POPJA
MCFAKHSTITLIRVFRNINIGSFVSDLKREHWDGLSESLTIDENYDVFRKTFNYYFNKAFPLKEQRHSITRANWVTSEIKGASQNLKDLNQLVKQGLCTREYYNQRRKHYANLLKDAKMKKQGLCTREYYNQRRKHYANLLKDAKMKYNSELVKKSNNKSKFVWNIVNNTIKPNRAMPTLNIKNEKDEMVDDPAE